MGLEAVGGMGTPTSSLKGVMESASLPPEIIMKVNF
jgi:hypothetical protein